MAVITHLEPSLWGFGECRGRGGLSVCCDFAGHCSFCSQWVVLEMYGYIVGYSGKDNNNSCQFDHLIIYFGYVYI